MRERFVREAQAAAAIDHPNVCTVHEVDEVDGQHFIVMEFVRGHSLRDRLAQFTGDMRLLLDVARQVADGLREAHRAGVVHRDLNGANVMLTERSLAKIMDFGLATRRVRKKERAGPDMSVTEETSFVTEHGVTVGTIAYLSPEQARGRDVDPRSDLFSFGVVLYEMSTGKRPFTGQSTVDIIDNILNAEPAPPTRLNAEIPNELEYIILKLLRKSPEERYQSADDVHADLGNLKRQYESSSAVISVPHRARERTLRSSLSIIVAVVLLVASTLTFLWAFARTRGMTGSSRTAVAGGRAGLAVFPFENRTGDNTLDWYGRGAAEWLSIDLSKIGSFNLISLHQLLVAARSLGSEAATPADLDVSRANEVAVEAGARYLLRGATLKLGDDVFVTAEVVEVSSGRVMVAERVTAVTRDNLTEKLQELAQLLRTNLENVP
jgi:serine/threonine protein kinase